jgi:DNA-binding transcriptional LysR family regulator
VLRAESSLAETLKALCLHDLGVAWLPRSSVVDELQSGALRIVGAEAFHVPVEVCAWRRLDLTHRRAVRLFEALPSLSANKAPARAAASAPTAITTRSKRRGIR